MEHTSQFQDLRYERPVGEMKKPTLPASTSGVRTCSPTLQHEDEDAKRDVRLVTLEEEVVVEMSLKSSEDDEECLWGTQVVEDEWLDETSYFWDAPAKVGGCP